MQAVKTRDTGPEVAVRKLLHREGYRYRLNVRSLPGSPDLVFPSRKRVLFVHGCFWHGHGCAKGQAPKSRLDYWQPKIEANRARDGRKTAALKALGWKVMSVWECETKNVGPLLARLRRFLDGGGTAGAR